MTFNPFYLEAFRRSVRSALDTAAYSESGYEHHCAVLDDKAQLVDACGPNPSHFPSLQIVTQSLKKYIPVNKNEIYLCTDPYSGNTTVTDLTFIKPFSFGSPTNIWFLVFQISVPGLLKKDTFGIYKSIEEEGFRIPPKTVWDRSGLNTHILAFLESSFIPKNELENIFGSARKSLMELEIFIQEIGKQWKLDEIQTLLKELNKLSTHEFRLALSEYQDGDHGGLSTLDSDGVATKEIPINCKISIHGEKVGINFVGTSRQVQGPFNSSYSLTLGACLAFFMSLLKQQVPINQGLMEAFFLEAPDGSLVNPKYPASTFAGQYETVQRIFEALKAALSKASPHEVPAESGGTTLPVLMGFEDKMLVETFGVGLGGGKRKAGESCVKSLPFNRPSLSVEEIESRFPLQIIQNSIREGTGGIGKYPGGNGITRGYKFLAPARVLILTERLVFKPQGAFGGIAATGSEIVANCNGVKKKVQTDKCFLNFSAGDTLVINTPGGGSWGKPEEPPAEEG